MAASVPTLLLTLLKLKLPSCNNKLPTVTEWADSVVLPLSTTVLLASREMGVLMVRFLPCKDRLPVYKYAPLSMLVLYVRLPVLPNTKAVPLA